MKRGKRHMTEGVELPNQEKLTTLGERNPTNTWEISGNERKKIRKCISKETENYSRKKLNS